MGIGFAICAEFEEANSVIGEFADSIFELFPTGDLFVACAVGAAQLCKVDGLRCGEEGFEGRLKFGNG